MLIRDDGDTWTAITQPAHAALAAQLAAAWHEPLSPELLLAIAQHDIAWSAWDLEPPLNPDARRAAAFLETPMEERLARWSRVDRLLEAQSPYVALLVSLHATNIHTRYGDPARRPQAFLEETRAAQDELLTRLADAGVTREQAEADADLIFGFDAMSLALCLGYPETTIDALGGRTVRVEGRMATVDRWPFAADELTVSVWARTFIDRFDDEAELHQVLAAAPFERREWTLRPA